MGHKIKKAKFSFAQAFYEQPKASDNKYSRGVVGLITGSQKFPGAGILSTSGAVMSGCGMAIYWDLDEIKNLILSHHPEVVIKNKSETPDTWTDKCHTLVIGSGLNPDQNLNQDIVELFINDPSKLVVLDGSGLRFLFEKVQENMVITPHLGEAHGILQNFGENLGAGLNKKIGKNNEISEKYPEPSLELAQKLHQLVGATILLKGHTTYIVNSKYQFEIEAPTNWLATAGTGDVLAGVIGTLLAQNFESIQNPTETLTQNFLLKPFLNSDSNSVEHPFAEIGPFVATAQLIFNQAAFDLNPNGPISALKLSEQLPKTISKLFQSK